MLDNSSTVYIDLDNELQAFAITLLLLCFLGYVLVQMRVIMQGILYHTYTQLPEDADPGYIIGLFAGALLETMFLVSYIIIYVQSAYSSHTAQMYVYRITALFSNTVIAVQKLQLLSSLGIVVMQFLI